MKTFAFNTAEMLDVYRQHPLSRVSLLARVGRHHDLTERDLAYDTKEMLTDQNHIGGALFTLRLADRATVLPTDNVLDLGCGIGGSARLLATECGCRVHGVDANAERIRDAVELTRITNLTSLVTFENVDFLLAKFEPSFSLVWGQNSWIHVSDQHVVARQAASALAPRGRVAFDDVCVKKIAFNNLELSMFEELSDAWRSTVVPISTWLTAFEGSGFKIEVVEEDSERYVEHYIALTKLARSNPGGYPAHEIRGWECAQRLGESGALGFFRVIGQLP